MAAAEKKMTEEQLGALLDSEFETAQGIPGGDISNERAMALDYYMQKLFGTETEGESSVVTADVADVVDGMMPSLLRIFTTADNLCSFTPTGPEDVEKAEQESDYVNYVFFQENPAFLIIFVWMFDALVQKNGIVKAYADEVKEVGQETYKGLSEQDFDKLLMDDELEPVELEDRPGLVPGPDGSLQPGTVFDVKFRRVRQYVAIRVSNVAPENYRISADASSVYPSSGHFVGEEEYLTRSRLVAMGFDKDEIYALPAAGNERTSSTEKAARYDKSDDQQNSGGSSGAGQDKSQEKLLVRAGFTEVDFDGDGIAELRYVVKIGPKVFENEIADRQHFHVITPQPLPHKHFGRAVADKVMDIQLVKSTLYRENLNNLYRVNKPRHGVWEMGIGDNTLDDLLTDRLGGVVRFSRPMNESYGELTVQYTAGQSLPMIEMLEKAKRDRTGVSADSQGLSPEALKNIQIGVMSEAMDIGRMKIEMVARIFAETGIKSLFQHIHELLQKHQNKKCVVQLRNRWVEVDPSEWRTRKNMTVNIGLGIGTRASNLMHLEAIWNKQIQVMDKGGANSMVTARNLYNTASEIVKNANLKNPELYFTPAEKLGAPTDEQAQLMRQQQALQMEQQKLERRRQELDNANIQLKAREQMMTMRTRIAELQLDLREERRKTEKDRADAMIELQKLQNDLTEMELKYGVDVPGSKV